MGYRMFTGELDGHLVLAHIDMRADVVRSNIGEMFELGDPDKTGWKLAKKAGWRVVPVTVQKA